MKNYIMIILSLLGFINLEAQNFEMLLELKEDLNADSIVDEVKLDFPDKNNFVLIINDKEVTGNLGDPVDGMTLIDINRWDKYKEIAIHTPGPSNDDIFEIYWYDGKEIKLMTRLERWPEFTGNGIVYVNNWEGFWSPKDKYKLDNNTRELIHIDQWAYYVGKKIHVKTGFIIYKEPELENEVALLSDDSEIELILCDKKDKEYFDYMYLIKSSNGLLGWANFNIIFKSCEIHMAD